MNDQERQEIDLELATITPGPWSLRYLPPRHSVRSLSVMQESRSTDADIPIADVWLPVRWHGLDAEQERERRAAELRADADAAFIAAAPARIRALLDENKRLRFGLKNLEAKILLYQSGQYGFDPEPAKAVIRKALNG